MTHWAQAEHEFLVEEAQADNTMAESKHDE